MQKKHQKIFDEYHATFTPQQTTKWSKLIDKWDKNHAVKPDPYENVETCDSLFYFLSTSLIFLLDVSLQEARLELAKEEAREVTSTQSQPEISPSAFLHLGLELEEQQ